MLSLSQDQRQRFLPATASSNIRSTMRCDIFYFSLHFITVDCLRVIVNQDNALELKTLGWYQCANVHKVTLEAICVI